MNFLAGAFGSLISSASFDREVLGWSYVDSPTVWLLETRPVSLPSKVFPLVCEAFVSLASDCLIGGVNDVTPREAFVTCGVQLKSGGVKRDASEGTTPYGDTGGFFGSKGDVAGRVVVKGRRLLL